MLLTTFSTLSKHRPNLLSVRRVHTTFVSCGPQSQSLELRPFGFRLSYSIPIVYTRQVLKLNSQLPAGLAAHTNASDSATG